MAGPEAMLVPLERQPEMLKRPVFSSCQTNLNEYFSSFGQRHFHLSGGVILQYKPVQVITHRQSHNF